MSRLEDIEVIVRLGFFPLGIHIYFPGSRNCKHNIYCTGRSHLSLLVHVFVCNSQSIISMIFSENQNEGEQLHPTQKRLRQVFRTSPVTTNAITHRGRPRPTLKSTRTPTEAQQSTPPLTLQIPRGPPNPARYLGKPIHKHPLFSQT